MSYATIAKTNMPKQSEQPKPDLSLLESRNQTASASPPQDSNINIVSREEADAFREALRSPPSPETAKLEKDPLKPVPVSVPVKDPAVAASIAKVQALEKKIRDDLVAAEKKVEKKVESSKATAGKKADELEKKAKDVKKKVTKEFEKDEAIVRSFIRTHPVLIKGVLAFVNVTIVSALSVFSYQHRHLQIWNARRTSIVTVGLGLLAGVQAYSGIWLK